MIYEPLKPEDKKVLYEYWRTLPVLKHVPGKDYLKIQEQPIRGYILEILREGIEEIDPNTNLKVKRHVLTAKELHIEKNKKLTSKTSCTLSNIYFHLSILGEDPIYTKEIYTIKSGKQKIKYFGRTAKLFLYDDKDIFQDKIKAKNIISELSTIIALLNPTASKERIQSLLNEYNDKWLTTQLDTKDNVVKWIAKHETLLSEHNIDIRDLHEFLEKIFFDKSYIAQNITEISHLFNESL